METINRKAANFDASAMQIHQAYRAYFHQDIPDGTSYRDAAMQIVGEIGLDRAARFVKGQSNEVDATPVCLYAVENPDA
jgi:hypothetical protein